MKFSLTQFIDFTEQFEGKVNTMYRCTANKVTVGYGNMIEPIQLAWGLKWMRVGRRATQSEIIAEWNLINDTPGLDKGGWKAALRTPRADGGSPLYLEEDSMLDLVKMRLESNAGFIRQGFPDYDTTCADGQLFLHSMAWACGGLFWEAPPKNPRGYPKLRKFFNGKNFIGCMNECAINPKEGTIILRNEANVQLLYNTHRVTIRSKMTGSEYMNPDTLLFPKVTNDSGSLFFNVDYTVSTVQKALNLLGWHLVTDGVLGPKTKEAITKFQGIHKLKQDGIVGPLTREALRKALEHR